MKNGLILFLWVVFYIPSLLIQVVFTLLRMVFTFYVYMPFDLSKKNSAKTILRIANATKKALGND